MSVLASLTALLFAFGTLGNLYSGSAIAAGLFRLVDGKCTDGQKEGTNARTIGECGDLTNVQLAGLPLRGLDVRGSRALYPRLVAHDAVNLNANFAVWFTPSITNSNAEGMRIEKARMNGLLLYASKAAKLAASGASLRGARFQFSHLQGSDFRGADLRDSYCLESDLKNADLRGANLAGAVILLCDLRGARADAATILPFTRAVAESRGIVFQDGP